MYVTKALIGFFLFLHCDLNLTIEHWITQILSKSTHQLSNIPGYIHYRYLHTLSLNTLIFFNISIGSASSINEMQDVCFSQNYQ